MNVLERFLKYVAVDTPSDEESGKTPSSDLEWNLARVLAEDMQAIGITDAAVDEFGYVYGHIPATEGYEDAPALGFIAHMDTAPDFCGLGVKPKLIENYDGGELPLGESGRVLSPVEFPHLKKQVGKTLVVTDGTTLLGADDKAGVAEILSAATEILEQNLPHGRLCIGFTPDEEIGEGADHFSLEKFGADFAYTVDGGQVNVMEYENFNAAGATFEVHGFNVHPGSAKNIMINAQLVAMEINGMLPKRNTPRDTDGYKGFYHLIDMEGTVEKATLRYIIRDHDDKKYLARCEKMQAIADAINKKYGKGTVTVTVKEQYRNMASIIRENYHLVENALAAIREEGFEPLAEPIRGGTDGARLSFMGLPCPNLGTGGYAYHGPYEHAVVEEMQASVRIMKRLVRQYAGQKK